MIALEVSSAAGRAAYGGIPGAIRNLVGALLRLDPETTYALSYRLSRWRKGELFRPDAPNARLRVLQDPFNGLLLRGARILHSMGIFLPATPRIPKLLTVHDLNAVRNTQWVSARWHERRSARIRDALSRADHVVTYSEFTAAEVREEYGFREDRVHPVHLGVDAGLFRPLRESEVDEVRKRYGDYVISIGLLTPRKNFARLVEAMSRLRDLRLVLIGRASDGEEAVSRAIEVHGMGERVVRLSGIAQQELISLLGAARVCAVPSLYEGFGLTVLEAMACGVPVVCSTAASLPEAAGDAALNVDPTDVDGLEHALRRVVEDSDLAAELRRRGLDRARELSWEASAWRLRRLYRSVSGF